MGAIGSLSCLVQGQEVEVPAVAGSITPMVESHYISEGRDNLDGTGLFSTAIDAETSVPGGILALGAWYGSAYDTEYDEFNLAAGYTIALGENLTATLGYTYLNFRTDNADDHEASLDLEYGGIEGVTLFAGAYHSFDAEGFFSEIGLSTEVQLTGGVTVVPFALLGINQGYVGDGHDGANHAAIGFEASVALTETLSLEAYGAYTLAIDKDAGRYADDAALDDLVYGGLGLSAGF
jgi:hypothetical protein